MHEGETCNICRKKVLDTQEGLLCETCYIWKHRTCVGLTQRAYQQLNKSSNPWHCDTCKNEEEKNNQKQIKTKGCTLEDIMAKLEEMEKKYDILLTKYNEQLEINGKLQNELMTIKIQLNKQDQGALKNNIIIQGVPQKPNENLSEIVTKIGEKLEVQINKNFLAYRVGNTNEDKLASKPIKVIFEEETIKLNMIKSKKKFELQSKDLGFRENNKIYLNHDLTKTSLELYKAAKEYKKRMNFKFLWISNGNILLRKTDDSKVILVQNLEQLKN